MVFDGRLLGGVGVMAAVVETGNFARAGDALGLTQSGVSRAILTPSMSIAGGGFGCSGAGACGCGCGRV